VIPNLLNVLAGLWLAYSVIFSTPPGNMSNVALATVAVAVVALSAWARRTDVLGWPSATNLVLGAVLVGAAVVRWVIGVAPLLCFWLILLAGIAVAIAALWSVLYRPATAQSGAGERG
jgi:hypothetical protein